MSRPGQMASGWQLTKASLASLGKHFKVLVLVTAVVAVPANLIQLVAPSSDSSLSAYISLAAIIMNLALIWTIIQIEQGHSTKLHWSYYRGTAGFVRFLLVSVLLVLELIPIALGLLLYSVGVVGAAPGTSVFEKGFVGILALLLFAPSVFLINRSLLALVVVPAGDLGPVGAIKASWRRVKGHSFQVLRRYGSLIVATTAIIIIPALAMVYLYQRTTNRGWLVILQVFTSLIILPFINLYLYKLYQELE